MKTALSIRQFLHCAGYEISQKILFFSDLNRGDARVEIGLFMDNGQPVANVEVDLAEKPGPPPKGGVAVTDENGIAVFNVQPGNYFVYFNSGKFPKNLQEPEPQPIQVDKEAVNKKTIILDVKEI
jgi:hypothetical protein